MLRCAKIVATVGPASSEVAILEKMIRAGLDVARVNMSHGTYEAHTATIAKIREASLAAGKEVAILLDLQGPKIRVDKLPAPLELKDDEEWVICPSSKAANYPEYAGRLIPTVYENLVEDCHDGARILFDDGLMRAVAIKRDRDVYKIKIEVGGLLKSNKGINLPDCDVSAPAFTDKDRDDLMFGLKQQIDYIALSFVRKREDVMQVKALLHKLRMNVPIIAKIEKPQAIDNLDEIMSVCDVIMVARGDMGVEVGNHLVPSMQKLIITKCNQAMMPVITATQMLESMTENPTPTRAEASDVANAIWDGTDAVMLSGETAAGKWPVQTIKMMEQIVIEAERTPKERPLLRNMDLSNVNASVMVAASMIAEKVDARYILSMTESGSSTRKISMFRPRTPVLGVTNSLATARRMCLHWGVRPFQIFDYGRDDFNFQKDVVNKVKSVMKLQNGDKIVITRGDGKFFARGSSNSVKVEMIRDMPKVLGSSDVVEEAGDAKKRILLDTAICASCQNCVTTCPHDIWTVTQDNEHRTTIDQSKISLCALDMACVEACPTGAIEIIPNN